MNFKRNYRFDLQPSWVRELSFSVYKKPKRFYMSDAYNYGEEVEHGTLIADEHGTFHGADANVGTITRYSFSVYSPKKRYLSVIVALNTKGKFWCNRRLIGI